MKGPKRHTKDTTSHSGGGVLGKEEVLCLSCICGSSTSSLQQPTLFGKGLLLHHRDKLLQGEQRLVQAFDRYAFERLLLMPDDQLLLNRVYTEVHIVAYQSLLNIISDVIEDHGAIVADFTNKVLAMHMAEPSIGVYQAWNWWQSRQRGKRDMRRAIPAG